MSPFETKLLSWYRKNGRKHLPWRSKSVTPYEVWVSEIMLQQTQVERVISYYVRLLKKYPTLSRLAKASWGEFYPYYAGLGYYNRGRNMLKCAQIVEQQYGGKFPKDKTLLKNLPGIGEYTARAILSFGFNENVLAIDTNVQKVLGRFFYGSREAAFASEEMEKELGTNKKELNAAMMDFSGLICTKVPACNVCPLQKMCRYFDTKGEKEMGKIKERQKFPTKDAQVHLCLHENHRTYYSSNQKKWRPFVLPAKYNTRSKIKEHFLKKYGLELAVRPPHRKMFLQGKPVLLVNAQILLGQPHFYSFAKKNVDDIFFQKD